MLSFATPPERLMNYLRLVDAQSFSQTKLTRYMEELCDSGALIMSLQPSARRMPICFPFRRNMWAQLAEYVEKQQT